MSLPPTRPAPESISYIVRTYPARGSFDVKRAKELGVKPGPDFGKLSNGTSVQNNKGETVTPEQVLGPDRPGQGFALLDIPSVEYLEAVVERDEFQSPDMMKGIEAFIWTLGAGVAAHPTLNQFMKKFGNIKHIISSADVTPNRIAYDSVAAQTTRLAQVDPIRYQTPQYDLTSVPQKLLSEADHMQQTITVPENVVIADRGLSATVMPKFDLKPGTRQAPFEPEAIREETSPDIRPCKILRNTLSHGARFLPTPILSSPPSALARRFPPSTATSLPPSSVFLEWAITCSTPARTRSVSCKESSHQKS
jgi:ribonuclease Z